MKTFIFLMLFALSAHAIEFAGVETTKMTNIPGFEDCTYNSIRISGILPTYVRVVKCPNSATTTTVKKNKNQDDTVYFSDKTPVKK